MNPSSKRHLLKQLSNFSSPFPYRLIYYDDENDIETPEINGHVIYVELLITPNVCNLLKNIYKTRIYFYFPDDYPFNPPTIMLEDPVTHPTVNCEQINTCDYGCMFTFPQLILNSYCIITEALNNKENMDLINYINNH